jgi:hypothetical protein
MRSFIFKIGTLSFCISLIFYTLTGLSIPEIIVKSFIIFISVSILTTIIVIVVMMFTQKVEKEEDARRLEMSKKISEPKNGFRKEIEMQKTNGNQTEISEEPVHESVSENSDRGMELKDDEIKNENL